MKKSYISNIFFKKIKLKNVIGRIYDRRNIRSCSHYDIMLVHFNCLHKSCLIAHFLRSFCVMVDDVSIRHAIPTRNPSDIRFDTQFKNNNQKNFYC